MSVAEILQNHIARCNKMNSDAADRVHQVCETQVKIVERYLNPQEQIGGEVITLPLKEGTDS